MKEFPLPSDPKIIIIPVRIAGPASERYVRVIVDTGATYTLICPDAAEEIGLDLSKPIRTAAITTASGMEPASFFTLPTMEIFGHRIQGIEIASHRLPERVPADGLLGLNVLTRFNVHLEFLKRRLRLTP